MERSDRSLLPPQPSPNATICSPQRAGDESLRVTDLLASTWGKTPQSPCKGPGPLRREIEAPFISSWIPVNISCFISVAPKTWKPGFREEQHLFSYTNKFQKEKKLNLLKIYSPSGHWRCKWVCFFIRTDLEKFSIASLTHQWTLCSEWVPSEWESKQLITT